MAIQVKRQSASQTVPCPEWRRSLVANTPTRCCKHLVRGRALHAPLFEQGIHLGPSSARPRVCAVTLRRVFAARLLRQRLGRAFHDRFCVAHGLVAAVALVLARARHHLALGRSSRRCVCVRVRCLHRALRSCARRVGSSAHDVLSSIRHCRTALVSKWVLGGCHWRSGGGGGGGGGGFRGRVLAADHHGLVAMIVRPSRETAVVLLDPKVLARLDGDPGRAATHLSGKRERGVRGRGGGETRGGGTFAHAHVAASANTCARIKRSESQALKG